MPIVSVFPDSTAGFDGVVAPSPTSDSKASGVALSAKTFGAFTDPNGLIDNYNAVTTNADGTCSWSGSGLGPYTPTSADGDSGTLELQARDSSNNVLASAIHSYDRAAAGGGAAGTLSALLDIDFTALSAYNFLTTGGSGGTGGDGPHSVGGYTFELSGSSQLTQLEITANGLEMAQNTGGAFQLGVNLRDLATAIDPAGPCHVLTRVASAVSGEASGGVQVGAQRDPTLGNWTTGDAVARYRKADATPDFLAVVYNGGSFDTLASGTVTANDDVRLEVGLTSLYGTVLRGDTGTATDPADWDVLPEFAAASYSSALASFSGTYPASSDLWAFVGCGLAGSGIFKTLTAYGLEA